MKLYVPNGFDIDPTYSKDNFYKNIKQPTWKFDIKPQAKDVIQLDARKLDYKHFKGIKNDYRIQSIMFDPPFICGEPKKAKNGIIRDRFGHFPKITDLWNFYKDCLTRFYEILDDNGILVFKCQDTVDSSKQCLTHVEVTNVALNLGFYPRDLFTIRA